MDKARGDNDVVVRQFTIMTVVWRIVGMAVGYNAIPIPLAATGLLEPWMAALGMSAS